MNTIFSEFKKSPTVWRSAVALWAAALAAALLTGCVSVPRGEEAASYATETADVPFHAQGRFSARYEDKAVVARFDWRHTPDTDEIKLTSPLGTTVAVLTREGDTITVQQGDRPQHTQHLADWEDLATQTFGFPLPITSLSYWLRGVPAPGAATVTRDAIGRFDNLRQQGWTVQYSYAAAAREPERVDIQYGETLGLRFRVDRFLLLEAN
ncbi:MAG: lipoprotein insertase outer membrane protein LolB [Proteobacteria bacterium]|nr:lipoprotein insertase outer membrane protein LolB [Pseudomonadota bacterium]MCL2308522.1 lipoprotein insertase outer membrane protein LolB [Pseudomonadota bacterium]